LKTFHTTCFGDVFFHQVNEAGNGGCGSLDIVGNGEKKSFTLVHDALNFFVGCLKILPVDALFSSIAPDEPNHDDNCKECY
jgi:hypothetical protein